MARAQSEYQKLYSLYRSSIGSIRECLISLEERLASDKKEVSHKYMSITKSWVGSPGKTSVICYDHNFRDNKTIYMTL